MPPQKDGEIPMCTASALCPLCGQHHDAAMPCPETSPTACACPTAHEHARHEDGHAHCACGHDHAPAAPLDPHAFGVPSATRAVYRITNMDCPVEEALIRKKLEGMAGITGLEFHLNAARSGSIAHAAPTPPPLKRPCAPSTCLPKLWKRPGPRALRR